MTATHVALLRAVNVAGHGVVAMADLRGLLTRLGFSDVKSLLASGNLVLRTSGVSAADLERLFERETAARLGLATDFFVRTAAEWKAIVACNPFPAQAESDPGRLVVALCKDAPSPQAVEALRRAITGPETVAALGRELYAVYPAGIGRSRLTTALVERTLGTRVTGRNWNTVLKLGALVGA